jgi:NDP-sugar pyrophosphorylase family protein
MVNGQLTVTGRRKFGVVIGDGVHTGINTSFYPGRKLWPGRTTLPGEVVKEDKS